MEPPKRSQTIEGNLVEIFSGLFLFPLTLGHLLARPPRCLAAMDAEAERLVFAVALPCSAGLVPLNQFIARATGQDGLG